MSGIIIEENPENILDSNQKSDKKEIVPDFKNLDVRYFSDIDTQTSLTNIPIDDETTMGSERTEKINSSEFF